MGPIMLSSILLMAIVTVCINMHVLWCIVVHGKDFVSRNPKDDFLYCKCDLFGVSRITCDVNEFPNNCALLQ